MTTCIMRPARVVVSQTVHSVAASSSYLTRPRAAYTLSSPREVLVRPRDSSRAPVHDEERRSPSNTHTHRHV